MRARIAASSGPFSLNREISVCAGLRGGAGRTRTSNQTIISSWLAKCPKWRGLRVRALCLHKQPIEFQWNDFGGFVQKFRFRARRSPPTETLLRLLRRKAEHLVLAGPLRWQVGEASNAPAVGEPAIDGCLDQIGRKESQRDCHVDLSRVFPLCDGLSVHVPLTHPGHRALCSRQGSFSAQRRAPSRTLVSGSSVPVRIAGHP